MRNGPLCSRKRNTVMTRTWLDGLSPVRRVVKSRQTLCLPTLACRLSSSWSHRIMQKRPTHWPINITGVLILFWSYLSS